VTRRYRAEAVPDALLDTVLAAASSAPSKSDMQQWSVVVLQDAGKIAAIADWIGTMPWIKQAPVFLVFCADVRRGRDICERAGREHANDNLDTMLNATVDAALAMGMTIAAADAAGLQRAAWWAELTPLVVEASKVDALRARLEAAMRARDDEVMRRPDLGWTFVPAATSYWFPNTCADVVAAWCEELGCTVSWVPICTALAGPD
jgi:nitroreductase